MASVIRMLGFHRASIQSIRARALRLPRHLHTTVGLQSKKDDLMDKDSINTTSTEYSKTGGGDSGAAHTEEAFDPDKTRPDEGKDEEDSLKVSPDNPEVSKPRGKQEGGAERSQAEANESGSKAKR